MAASNGEPSSIKFPPADPGDRDRLISFVRSAPLSYGSWGPLKRLYKQVEIEPAAEPGVFGALAARIDAISAADVTRAMPTLQLSGSAHSVSAIAAQGDRVYLLATLRSRATELAAFHMNPDNPLKLDRLGAVELRSCHALLACGPYVVALCGGLNAGTADVYDPAVPGGPLLKGRAELYGYGVGAASYPYVILAVSSQQGKFSGLKVVDISNPVSPQVVSEIEVKGISHIAVDGALAAAACQKSGLSLTSLPSSGGVRIFDIGFPRRPRLLGSANVGNAKAVALQDGLAALLVEKALAAFGMELVIVDVRDPAHPVKVGAVDAGRGAKSVTLAGRVAYIVNEWGAASIVDLKNPAAPAICGQLDHYGATSIAIAGSSAFVASQHNGIALYNIANPAKPARIGSPPSRATFAYMKRRVRRYLRKLSVQDPDAYVELAVACLGSMTTAKALKARSGAPEGPHMSDRWVLADILYGGSDRYIQSRHSRGPLVSGVPRLRARRREERAPSAWDRHPEALTPLLADDTLPWQTHEAVFKILEPQGEDLRGASDALLARYLGSEAPLLIYYAARRVADRLHRRALNVELVAGAYVKSPPPVRREIERDLPDDSGWRKSFAEALLLAAQAWKGRYGFTRRAATACEILARRFPDAVAPDLVVPLASDLLNARRPLLVDLVRSAARLATMLQVTHWLTLLDAVRPGNRGNVAEALAEAMRGQVFTPQVIQPLVFSDRAFVRESAWTLLEASSTGASTLNALWTSLLESPQSSAALSTAMTSPAALALLSRAGIGPEQLAAYVLERPFLAEMLVVETFSSLLSSAPASVVLTLVAAANEAQWHEWRGPLLAWLSDPAAAFEFWPHVDPALRSDPEGVLAGRLLGDAAIASTLQSVDDPALLDFRDPAFGSALAEWARSHEALFTANSPLLLQGATHVLPDVRAWSLERVRAAGMDLPFALRLLESQLPASVTTGMSFFEAVPAGDPRERSNALALCDSPFLSVRRIGQEYVTARWASLPQADVLTALFESFHPDIQAFVAALLGQSVDTPQQTPAFDREVLRARQKARRAKELVKARQSAQPTVDTATLLSLARGRTPRDADWALAELTRRAVAGEQIEGITIEGVVGG